jgi:PAS domain S-box-containing protein
MFASLSLAGAEPRRVLLVHSFGREFAPFDTFSGNFRTELVRQAPQAVDIYEVSLESARFSDNPQEGPIVDYLLALFAGRRLNLVVPIGGPAVRFAQKYRQQLFPATPMLLAADQRHLQKASLTTNDTVVAVIIDLPRAVENILRLLPQTTHVFVVVGHSPLEQFWLGEMRREFQPFTNRVTLVWLNELSLAEMLKRCTALPPRSAIFYALLAVDANGVPHVEERALAGLHAVANAPIFGLLGSQLGRGIVGGPLVSIDDLSRNAANVAVRILRGESPGDIKTPPQGPGTPMFDWRELRRWDIREASLPPGSIVRFHEPTAWERYKWRIMAIASLFVVQALLIFVLLANRIKRRRAERSLIESEARFRIAADAAPVMIWMSGPDKLCTFFNKPWLEFTGRRLEQEMGNRWAEGVHPDDLQRCLTTYVEAFDARQPFVMEYRLRRRDGEYRWISDSGRPRHDNQGKFAGYIGSCVDITESQRKAEALAESENRLRAILDTAVEGIITVNDRGVIESVNAATEKIFGYTAAEIIGRNIGLLMPAPFREGHDEHLANFQSTRAPEILALGGREVSGRRKDGSVFPIDLAVSELMLANRQIFTGFVRDVTERKQAERIAREFGGRLIRAQEEERARLARELHDDITQRLALLAIDAGRVERASGGVDLTETMREVRDGLVRLSEDVHSLSYKLHPALLEDLGLTDALKAECERVSRQESISVEVKLEAIPERIPQETGLCLFRVTQEALRNVARHARAKAAAVSLRPLDGGLQLAVADSGIGFDPGQQRQRPSLGLASMQERVRLLGGELDIESAPGHGTSIVAWVPLGKAEG